VRVNQILADFGRVDGAPRAVWRSYAMSRDQICARRVSYALLLPRSYNKEAMHAAGINYILAHQKFLPTGRSTRRKLRFADHRGAPRISLLFIVRCVMPIDAITIDRELATIRLADDAARKLGVNQPRTLGRRFEPHASENGCLVMKPITSLFPKKKKEKNFLQLPGPSKPSTQRSVS